MQTTTWHAKRDALETYFDRTAVKAWERLTSDAPVSGIRATVRAGRDSMRATLMSWLPTDMTGLRLLDAGCGTGALAVEAARRGAHVVAIDVSPTLVGLAAERHADCAPGHIEFRVGDMLDAGLGRFDYVVAMDSLIHYRASDIVSAVAGLVARTERAVLITFAPRTPLLSVMHAVGKLFPRGDRAPAILPVGPGRLRRDLAADARLAGWHTGRSQKIQRGFYTSQAHEIARA